MKCIFVGQSAAKVPAVLTSALIFLEQCVRASPACGAVQNVTSLITDAVFGEVFASFRKNDSYQKAQEHIRRHTKQKQAGDNYLLIHEQY